MRSALEQWVRTAWYAPQQLAGLGAVAWNLCKPAFWLLSNITEHTSASKRARIHSQKALAERAYVESPETNGPLVIVVGNLVAGGAGKTPIALALANGLIERGFKVGMIARGQADEAQWLKAHCLGPVVCHPLRALALIQIKHAHPGLQFVISDDGLQHEGLPRHKELVVIDPRGLGNGNLLPLGPLRESAHVVELADAIVLSKNGRSLPEALKHYALAKEVFLCSNRPGCIEPFTNPAQELSVSQWLTGLQLEQGTVDFSGLRLGAIAGIASPEDFFSQSKALLASDGAKLTHCAALADHSAMSENDLREFIERQGLHAVLMTEKDAPKYQHVAHNLQTKLFVQKLVTELDPRLIDFVAGSLVADTMGS